MNDRPFWRSTKFWGFLVVGAVALIASVFSMLLPDEERPPEPPRPSITVSPTIIPRRPPPQEVVATALRDLAQGTIVFDVPTKMKVGKWATVEVRISRALVHLLTEEARRRLREGLASPREKRVQVGQRMAAYLVDVNDAFTVRPLFRKEDVEQSLQATVPAAWVWRLRPERRGEQELALSVTAILFAPGREGPERISERVFQRTFRVQANWQYSATRFWGKHWQWILTPTLGGVIAAVSSWVRRRSSQKASQSKDSEK